MAIEPHDGASLPDALVENNPPSDDPVGQGDDHLRLLKITVKNFYTQYIADLLAATGRLGVLEAYAALGNADLLDGQHGAFYQNADNLNAGTVPAARLSGTYGINISGTAQNAIYAIDAAHAVNADNALLSANSTLFAGKTLAEVQAGAPISFSKSEVGAVTFSTAWTQVLEYVLPGALAEEKMAVGKLTMDVAVANNNILYFDTMVVAMPSGALVARGGGHGLEMTHPGTQGGATLTNAPGTLTPGFPAGGGNQIVMPVIGHLPAGTTSLQVICRAGTTSTVTAKVLKGRLI
jgi:hypothetical protein